MDIFLNHFDLYKMARHLGMKSTRELFDRRLVELKEGQKGLLIPKLLFKTHPCRFCPFLINDLDENNVLKSYCSLHPHRKPLVCILAPTSREFDTESGESRFFHTRLTDACSGTTGTGDADERADASPVLKEIRYEEIFFRTLDRILKKDITDYLEDLYYFPVSGDYDDIMAERLK